MSTRTARPVTTTGWRRLDRRTLLVHCGWLGAPLGSFALAALATGGRIGAAGWVTLGCLAVTFAAITAAGLARWARTDYRLTADSLDLRTGLLTRRLRTVPLHRVRTVDLTAPPLHRLLGVTVLRAGTAGSGDSGGELALEALSVRDAELLRSALLDRAAVPAPGTEPLLARIDWRWLRYAPLTFWVLGGVLAVAGGAYRALDGMGIEPWRLPFVQRAFTEFGASALWLTVPAALLGILALGSLGALGQYVEGWWNYRLEWADSRTLSVRRGLFTTRAVTIERDRLRGVVLREPLLLRAGGGGYAKAVAGGLGNREDNRRRSALMPPAPRATAVRVAAGALRSAFPEPESARHPRAALRRRRTRALLCVTLPGTLTFAVLGALLTPVLLHCAWVYALTSTPVALWLARDAYRSLGHGLYGRQLVVRSGTLSRDTVVLERAAVAAWTFSSSPFGRRAGLVTLTAAVAAGEDGYRIPDLSATTAPAFAAAAAPGIVDEFLERTP
ncbi:PH domain-containing protein [Streptomyces boluensis]|uniref:PH domain-containing protein n=1 Tax=Streptomyces boluensis TaxID=1775135 RepID=A0A964UQW7_9ACTN|nr:PH domain-containing protein [Streptomyces boluensis]NBE53127.1 PH domain-containing protein [Streptomyces boluensis]